MKQDGTENDLSRARAGLCLRTVSQEQTQVQPGTLHQCFSKVNKKHDSFAKCLAQLEDMNGVRHAQDLTWMWWGGDRLLSKSKTQLSNCRLCHESVDSSTKNKWWLFQCFCDCQLLCSIQSQMLPIDKFGKKAVRCSLLATGKYEGVQTKNNNSIPLCYFCGWTKCVVRKRSKVSLVAHTGRGWWTFLLVW